MKARLCPAAAAARRESPCPLGWRTGAAARAKARLSRPAGVALPCGLFKLSAPRRTRLLRRRQRRPLTGGPLGMGLDLGLGGWIRRKRRSRSASNPSRSRWRDKPGLERPNCEAGAPGRWRVAPLARSAHGGRVRRLNAGPLQRRRFSIHKKIPRGHFFYPRQRPPRRPVCGGACQCHVRDALRLRNLSQGARHWQATPIDMPLGAAQSGFPLSQRARNHPDLGQSTSLQLSRPLAVDLRVGCW